MSDEVPQLENGYVRIANDLLDAILRFPFSKRELLIVMAVIRKTYGYGKKSDDMTMTQLAELTGIQRSHVGETVKELEAKNVFLIRDGEYGKIIAIHKHYKLWKEVPVSGGSQIRNVPKTGNEGSQNGKRVFPKQEILVPETGHTKDNPKKQLQKTTPIGCTAPSVAAAPPPSAETWRAYAGAYEQRYGVPPVRNAKVSGQLAELVKRVGAEDAPHVAAFYVTHNSAFYVARGHAVGNLLADAEKLRTEWATNRQVTQTRARQMDRTETTGQVFREMIEALPNG